MFDESKDILWLAIAISVIGVSGFLSYLLLHTAHLVRESKRTVEDVNGKLKRVDPALDAITKALEEASVAVTSLRENVIEPIASIGGVIKSFSSIKGALGRFGKMTSGDNSQ
ncbi:MAG: hypothetical protein KC925_01625 [Candidatus Doudnabacteria bacterium]|nr:hypothetical protein [Candidatus Doudnabacteria bacterium]